jgi:uncharacterized protein with HEPN domain
MPSSSLTWLETIQRSASFSETVLAGVHSAEYTQNLLIRSAVERHPEIIGESLMRIRRVDETTAAMITDVPKIIGPRHRLAHGYDEQMDDAIVFRVARESVPLLAAEVATLIERASEERWFTSPLRPGDI